MRQVRAGVLAVAVGVALLFAPAFALQALALNSTVAMTATPASAESAQPEQPIGSAATNKVESTKMVDETESYRHSPSVAWFGRMFGMKQETAANVFELLNFMVLLALVIWFLARSLPKIFGTRTESIQKQLVEARTATEEATQRMNAVEQRLAKLDEEIAAIGAQAQRIGEQDSERIKAAAEEDKNKIVAAAEQEIAAAATNAQRQIRQFAAELAIDQAARRISINAETDRLLVLSFAGRLVGDDKSGQN